MSEFCQGAHVTIVAPPHNRRHSLHRSNELHHTGVITRLGSSSNGGWFEIRLDGFPDKYVYYRRGALRLCDGPAERFDRSDEEYEPAPRRASRPSSSSSSSRRKLKPAGADKVLSAKRPRSRDTDSESAFDFADRDESPEPEMPENQEDTLHDLPSMPEGAHSPTSDSEPVRMDLDVEAVSESLMSLSPASAAKRTRHASSPLPKRLKLPAPAVPQFSGSRARHPRKSRHPSRSLPQCFEALPSSSWTLSLWQPMADLLHAASHL